MTNMQAAAVTNPTYVSGLNPTPAEVITQIEALQGLVTLRDTLLEQVKTITEKIHLADDALTTVFTDGWAPQAQTAIAGDTTKAKTLGYGIKGTDTGHTPINTAIAKVLESSPLIGKIDINTHLQHTLHILNDATGKKKLPVGILRIDVYGVTGGNEPADLAALITAGGGYLGEATAGKFVNAFTGNVGKIEYYIAVYVDKKTKKPVAQSPVASALIN